MDYVAIKKTVSNINTLYIDEHLIASKEEGTKLTIAWLKDMGCYSHYFNSGLEPTIDSVFGHAFTHSECHHSEHHVNIDKLAGGYRIEYTYTEEVLTYKKKDDENT